MKKTVSGKTVNQIMRVWFWFMVVGRVLFFALFVAGVVDYISGHYKVGGYLSMIAAALGGIIEPGLVGGYKRVSTYLENTAAIARRTVAIATDEEIENIKWDSQDCTYLVVRGYNRDMMFLSGVGIWSPMQVDAIRMPLAEAAMRAKHNREWNEKADCRVITETGATTIF
jgi:hypothetical protein